MRFPGKSLHPPPLKDLLLRGKHGSMRTVPPAKGSLHLFGKWEGVRWAWGGGWKPGAGLCMGWRGRTFRREEDRGEMAAVGGGDAGGLGT